MSISDRIDKTAKIVGIVVTGAVGLAQLASFRYGDKPVHLALYLVKSAWVEVTAIISFMFLFFVLKWLVKKMQAALSNEGDSLAGFLQFRVLSPSLIGICLLCILCVQTFYVVRARRYFWEYLCTKSYVENYKQRIDQLAATGRISDAYNLNSLVMQMVLNTPEREYLERRRETLEGLTSWSKRLAEGRSLRSWNPVSDRAAYYRLLEAVRLNPQNYVAADILKQVITPLESRDISNDLSNLCASSGKLDKFSGLATPRLEAEFRWSKFGQQPGCETHVHEMSAPWNLPRARCILRLSDHTRLPFVKPATTDSESSPVDLKDCV